MCTSEVAQHVSNTLVQEALAHVERFITDSAWLRQNRKLWHHGAEFAYWEVCGNNFLTQKELALLKEAFQNKGWRGAIPAYLHHHEQTNWKMTVQLAC